MPNRVNAYVPYHALPLLSETISQLQNDLDILDELEIPQPLSSLDLQKETISEQYVVVWTDGSCQCQDNPYLRRAGYGVVYEPSRTHSRSISTLLAGPEQTAQRAEVRAVLAALAIENSALHIRSDSI